MSRSSDEGTRVRHSDTLTVADTCDMLLIKLPGLVRGAGGGLGGLAVRCGGSQPHGTADILNCALPVSLTQRGGRHMRCSGGKVVVVVGIVAGEGAER